MLDEQKLINVLRVDEGARRHIKHVLAVKEGTAQAMDLIDVNANSVRDLEACGVYMLVDNQHVLADEVNEQEIHEILSIATDMVIDDKAKNEQEEQKLKPQVDVKTFFKREWMETWKRVTDDGTALEYMGSLVNPKITKLDHVKQVISLSLISAGDKFGDRGRIHVLLHGPEGTAKSAFGTWLVHRLGIEGASHRSSDVGLTADARGEEITPGALPAADGGAIYIDELDKFEKKDLNGLLEAMEEGEVIIRVGKIHARLSARCRIITSANRIEKFSSELLDRFDFVVQMVQPEIKEEQEIAGGIVRNWRKEKPYYFGEELRGYLDWIKSYEPDISDETNEKVQIIVQRYIALEESVRGSARKKEALLRVAYALAKCNRREMYASDVIGAIMLVNPTFNDGKLEMLKEAL